MALSDAMKAILLDEVVTTDPLGIGYAAMGDNEVAISINALVRLSIREFMTSREIGNEIDLIEWGNLGTDAATKKADQDRIVNVLGIDEINPQGIAVEIFKDIFGAGSVTLIALNLARQENISRASEIGLPPRIAHQDVARVRGRE